MVFARPTTNVTKPGLTEGAISTIAPFCFPIFLIGFMAVGKTTVGRALAQRLQVPFLDVDDVIEERFSCPISQFFALYGEAEFRDRESEILAEELKQPTRRVIAAGGGIVLRPENRQLIRERSSSCHLDMPFPTIWERITRERDKRPLVRQRTEADVRHLWEERRDLYRQTAHLTINEDLPVEALVDLLISKTTISCVSTE